MMGKSAAVPANASMSRFHLSWSAALSTETPITLVLRFLNSPDSWATAPNSVVHTGVKSLVCENRMAKPLPIHSWKLIFPAVVLAVKSGAMSLMRSPMVLFPSCRRGVRGHGVLSSPRAVARFGPTQRRSHRGLFAPLRIRDERGIVTVARHGLSPHGNLRCSEHDLCP